MKTKDIYLPKVVGKGYATFWNCKRRYRVVKGSRASKKSKTTALWFIVNMMKYPEANTLVVRKTYRTLKDSCLTELKWAINRLEVQDWWDVKENPLEITYKPTGQKIYFRGLDDPLKVTSITVEHGVLCWAWLEEAYEVMNEADFDMLDESIRGECPQGLWKMWTITFNPWNERHWLKKRFFEKPDMDVMALTTNYKCNEFLDDADRKLFENMKVNNPRRYQVAGLGNWGIVDGLVYENWEERSFTLDEVKRCDTFSGLDFGYTNDPSAFLIGFFDKGTNTIYVWDEFYKKGMSNAAIASEISKMGYSKEQITADCAEPKSIDEIKGLGINRIRQSKKGPDSIMNGVQWVQDRKIVIHPRCVNFITEISNYTWQKDKFGKSINKPIDDFNHLMDAMRYGLEKYITKGNSWTY